MTEQEFHRILSNLLWHPPRSSYTSSSGGIYEDTDYFKFKEEILTLIKEAGYRLPPTTKAPLLTDKEIMACQGVCAQCDDNSRAIAQAQNDSDHKFYGGKE